jgi:hypothetical protein
MNLEAIIQKLRLPGLLFGPKTECETLFLGFLLNLSYWEDLG